MWISFRSFGRHYQTTTPPNNVTKLIDSHIYAQSLQNMCVYSDETNRIEADNSGLINLVTSIQVNGD